MKYEISSKEPTEGISREPLNTHKVLGKRRSDRPLGIRPFPHDDKTTYHDLAEV